MSMMEQQLLSRLTEAAAVVLAPTQDVQERVAAEQVFLDFRSMNNPYSLCKYVLDNCRVDYILFESGCTLKEAIIREWNTMRPEGNGDPHPAAELCQYLFYKVTECVTPMTTFVREKIVQVIAIIVKRASVDDEGKLCNHILEQLQSILTSDTEHYKKIAALSLIYSILQEYSTTNKSAEIGITWSTHMDVKQRFENGPMLGIFRLCVQMLGNLCKTLGDGQEGAPPPSDETISLLKQSLQIADTMFTWIFVHPLKIDYPNRTIESKLPNMVKLEREVDSQSSSYHSFMPVISWREMLFETDVVSLFFELHWKIRLRQAHLAHHTQTCLVLLATLNGPVLSVLARSTYVASYLSCFVQFLSGVTVLDREAVSMSLIILKLMIFHNTEIINSQLRATFLFQVLKLTNEFLDGAGHEQFATSKNLDDERAYTDAFENALKALMVVDIAGEVKDAATALFDKFLAWKLFPPAGIRIPDSQQQEEEVHEFEEEDDVKYRVQLESIGLIGRANLERSSALLCSLLEERTDIFCNMLANYRSDASLLKGVIELNEDIHWLLLMTGYLLTDCTSWELDRIPAEVMQYSRSRPKPDLGTFEKLEQSLEACKRGDPIVHKESIDRVVALIYCVIRICVVQQRACFGDTGQILLMSPMVMATSATVLARICDTYFLFRGRNFAPGERSDSHFRTELEKCFAIDSFDDSLMGVVIGYCQTLMRRFAGEKALMSIVVKLLECVVENHEKCHVTVKTSVFWTMDSLMEDHSVTADVKRLMYRVFTLAASGLNDGEPKRLFLIAVVTKLVDRLSDLVADERRLRDNYHNEEVRNIVVDTITQFTGVTDGCIRSTATVLYPQLVESAVAAVATLMRVYYSYQLIVQTGLEFFLSANKAFSSLGGDIYRGFCDHLSRAMDAYQLCSFTDTFQIVGAERENAYDETCQDLVFFLDLLNDLADTMFPIFSDTSVEEFVSEICSKGMRCGLSRVSPELLNSPILAEKYFVLLSTISENKVEMVYRLPESVLASVMRCVEALVSGVGGASASEHTSKCCAFLSNMARYMTNERAAIYPHAYSALQTFLRTLLWSALYCPSINWCDALEYSEAIYYLISIYKTSYEELIQELITSHPNSGDRIRQEFETLNKDLTFSYKISDRNLFQKKFQTFAVNVKGFLVIM